MSEPSMKTNADQTKSPGAQDDLKTLPMPEVQAKLGSSPDGLSQAEAQTAADAIRAERDCREDTPIRS